MRRHEEMELGGLCMGASENSGGVPKHSTGVKGLCTTPMVQSSIHIRFLWWCAVGKHQSLGLVPSQQGSQEPSPYFLVKHRRGTQEVKSREGVGGAVENREAPNSSSDRH
jgi:hypothetical protein